MPFSSFAKVHLVNNGTFFLDAGQNLVDVARFGDDRAEAFFEERLGFSLRQSAGQRDDAAVFQFVAFADIGAEFMCVDFGTHQVDKYDSGAEFLCHQPGVKAVVGDLHIKASPGLQFVGKLTGDFHPAVDEQYPDVSFFEFIGRHIMRFHKANQFARSEERRVG